MDTPDNHSDCQHFEQPSTQPDYVESLQDSMETHGYLAEYPIEVFESKNIPIETDKPFLCACGAHRTLAALKADIDAVLVVIHDGGEEDWIERMSLDNFKFDVVKDASIGQAFSQKEKRAACTQLLLLPKYLKMTNTALAEAWNTSEANIRRWRGEVASLIGERSEELQNWGVSPKRLKRLEAVLNSTEREDADGNVVKVRQKAREATEKKKAHSGGASKKMRVILGTLTMTRSSNKTILTGMMCVPSSPKNGMLTAIVGICIQNSRCQICVCSITGYSRRMRTSPPDARKSRMLENNAKPIETSLHCPASLFGDAS